MDTIVRYFPGRQRWTAPLAWLRRRLDPAAPEGLPLTVTVVFAVLCAWTFTGLTRAVLAGDTTDLDQRVYAFVVAHRTGLLTLIMRDVTWLGSSFVLVPLYLAVTAVMLRERRRREALYLWVAFLGAVILYQLAKRLIARPRPPAINLIGHASGLAFPSGHATQATVAWGMLAAVLSAGRARRERVLLLAAAAVVVLLVGTSRVYLGAHWLSDVLGGYALGGAWLFLILAPYRALDGPSDTPRGFATMDG